MSKVTVPKEVAKALDYYRNTVGKTPKQMIQMVVCPDSRILGMQEACLMNYHDEHPWDYFDALRYGYVAEKTPEDKVREYFDAQESHSSRAIIIATLNKLNAQISGINK